MFEKIKGNIFKSEDSRFLVSTGFKFVSLSGIIALQAWFFIHIQPRMNYLFFKANGYSDIKSLKEAYYEFILSSVVDKSLFILIYFILLFFAGMYFGKMILRPFANIGDYSERAMEDDEASYEVDQFSDYRLLTRFSDLFFEWVLISKEKKSFAPHKIPRQFLGFHKPALDRQYLINFSFILLIISLCTVISVSAVIQDLQISTVELATKTLKESSIAKSDFLKPEAFFIEELNYYVIFLVIILYSVLGIHLYQKVSGAAFGIFSTMRSFIKGNFSARVHLVGYSYVREHTRKLNKFLDSICKNHIDNDN